jgi:hypothetical protein
MPIAFLTRSPRFAIGIPGYWYKQVGSDDHPLLDGLNLGGFRGESLALAFLSFTNQQLAAKT